MTLGTEMLWRFHLSLVAACCLMICGCGQRENPFSIENIAKRMDAAKANLTSKGVKIGEKQYPIGVGLSVTMENVTIDDQFLNDLGQFSKIAEIHAARSNMNDDLLKKMVEMGFASYLNVLDISGTEVTDAGLLHVAGAPFLGTINIKGSKVTDQGIKDYNTARQTAPDVNPMFRKPKFVK